MICRDEMSLACDLAEVYHIYDYKNAAAFLSGGVFYGSASRQPMQDAALGG